MKKVFLVMLSIIMICSICFVLAGCSSVSNDDVIGVWENVTWEEGDFELYLYVYESGMYDSYGTHLEDKTDLFEFNEKLYHTYYGEWSIEEGYFVQRDPDFIGKYKVDGTKMYDSQGKLIYKKTSYSVKDDVVITK